MKKSVITIVLMLAGTSLAADATNTVVAAKVTAHRMTAAGSMEPGGGFYLYQTDFVVTSPTNAAGIILTMESFDSDPNLARSNSVAAIRLPSSALQAAKAERKPLRVEPSQVQMKTESNKEPEATR